MHKIGFIKKSAISNDFELVEFRMCIDCLVVEDKCIDNLVDITRVPGFVFGIEVLIDAIYKHVFTDTDGIKKTILDLVFGHFSVKFYEVSKFFAFEIDSGFLCGFDDSEIFNNCSFLFVIFQDKACMIEKGTELIGIE